jgi:hypothetical protein
LTVWRSVNTKATKNEEAEFLMKAIIVTFCALLFITGAFAQQAKPANTDHDTGHATLQNPPTDESAGTPGVITGYVRDIACLVQNPKAGAATTPVAKDCLKECVRGGSPLVILSEDGLLYVPISTETPDKSVHSQMLPYAGKYVKVSGNLFEARRPAFNLNRENRGNHQAPRLQNPHFLRRPKHPLARAAVPAGFLLSVGLGWEPPASAGGAGLQSSGRSANSQSALAAGSPIGWPGLMPRSVELSGAPSFGF